MAAFTFRAPTPGARNVNHPTSNGHFAAAGSYSFKFTVMGKNAASTGFSIAFDDITLTPQ